LTGACPRRHNKSKGLMLARRMVRRRWSLAPVIT
jgi:hypothetical protein